MAEIEVRLRSIKEARKVLGNIGNTKTYELISQGKLIALSLGGRTLITEDSIQRLVASLPPAPIRMTTAHVWSEEHGEPASQSVPVISLQRGRRRKVPRQKQRNEENQSTTTM